MKDKIDVFAIRDRIHELDEKISKERAESNARINAMHTERDELVDELSSQGFSPVYPIG